MHKSYLTSTVFSLFILGLLITVSSCKKEETVPAPKADFNYEISGSTVTFTNTSTDGNTYSWDFGDGATSTEESPSHTYDSFAAYIVELTATNATGSDTKSVAVQVAPEITIDGDFSDWADIPVSATSDANNPGAVTKIKLVSSLTHIYVYVEGTADLGGFVSMYINTDNDTTTGWAPKNHVFDGSGSKTATQAGADFEIDLGGPWSDGSFSTEIWTWVEDAANTDAAEWSFEGDEVGSEDVFIKPVKTGNAYEFAIVRANFPGGIADKMSFMLVDVDIANDDWVETGYLPNDGEGFVEHVLFK